MDGPAASMQITALIFCMKYFVQSVQNVETVRTSELDAAASLSEA